MKKVDDGKKKNKKDKKRENNVVYSGLNADQLESQPLVPINLEKNLDIFFFSLK